MTVCSLGKGPAEAILAALTGGASLTGYPTTASCVLVSGSADPLSSPVELTVSGYSRQTLTWAGSLGKRHNNAALSWSLPDDTLIGGIVLLNSVWTSLTNPFAWVTIDTPIQANNGLDFVIPASSLVVQGYTQL
jgi:hypothetical protein